VYESPIPKGSVAPIGLSSVICCLNAKKTTHIFGTPIADVSRTNWSAICDVRFLCQIIHREAKKITTPALNHCSIVVLHVKSIIINRFHS
jgi:hypothetical protein